MFETYHRVFGEALVNSERIDPNKTAIIFESQEFTYSKLKNDAVKLAQYLIANGLNKGDRVAVYLPNSWESIVSIFAITLSGGVFVIINPQTKANKLRFLLEDSGAKFIISARNLTSTLVPSPANKLKIECIVLCSIPETDINSEFYQIDFYKTILEDTELGIKLPRVIPNDLAAIIYTSGTTGLPKGVMLTHQNIVFTSMSLIELLKLNSEDIFTLFLPLSFGYGLSQLILTITTGGTLLLEKSFNFPASIYKNIIKYKPTVFSGVPTIFNLLVDTNRKSKVCFESITKITSVGATLPNALIPKLKPVFPNALVHNMYGQTECTRATYLDPKYLEQAPGSVGKAIPGTEVFLQSIEGTPVGINTPGLLFVRGPNISAGYWNNEKLTRETFKNGLHFNDIILSTNDWFKVDEKGFFYFLGRNDDIIKSRGEKISPVEIENVINTIEGVREVSVIGLPDRILGEAIVAFVSCHSYSNLTEKSIQQVCQRELEMYLIPQKIFFADELPKNANGKVNKQLLKKREIDLIQYDGNY